MRRSRTHKVCGVCIVQNASRDHCDVVRAPEVDKEEEADEVPIVEVSDTVVDPRTVVVHAQNTAGVTLLEKARRSKHVCY